MILLNYIIYPKKLINLKDENEICYEIDIGVLRDNEKNEGKTDVSQTWEDSSDSSFISDHKNKSCRMYFRVSGSADIVPAGAEIIEKSGEISFVTEKMTIEEAERLEEAVKAAEAKSR